MPIQFDNTYARLPDGFYARLDPSKVKSPTLIRINEDLAEVLGIDPKELDVEFLSGNRVAEGSEPLSMAYAGHQFGGFVPQLGDGRASILGEVVGKDGIRRDIQLKGSGPTPFSRRGDGRSALGPVIREYIVSEAMHALGVPTTRALAAVASGEPVARETMVPGGVFTRVARSHIRVGTFQYFAARHDEEALRKLADYAITRHYPEAHEADNPYLALLKSVIQRQAELIAHWMSFGFIHGVMNTDNCSIAGETIDFGPCAFMDEYHPQKKFSSIDHQGRYAFNNQGPIAHWNLARLAETLLPFFDEDSKQAVAIAEEALESFNNLHQSALKKRFTAKIGIAEPIEDDWEHAKSLLKLMTEAKADFTLTFRYLPAAITVEGSEALLSQFPNGSGVKEWIQAWRERKPSAELMRRSNPVYIPRNHRIEAIIEAAYQGDYEPFHRFNDLLQKPFDEQPDAAAYESRPTPKEVVCATFCGT
ncbi:MAG: protein adenylyltransferase SelO [Limisphaerales bacterium]